MDARIAGRWSALACALALAAGGIAACGDDDSNDSTTSDTTTEQTQPTETSGGGPAATTLAEEAVESGGLSFSKGQLDAKAGSVTVKLTNPSGNQLPHALEVEGNGVEEETETIEPGGEASVTVDLEPGTYEFYCPVGDHREQGMEGTLTVR